MRVDFRISVALEIGWSVFTEDLLTVLKKSCVRLDKMEILLQCVFIGKFLTKQEGWTVLWTYFGLLENTCFKARPSHSAHWKLAEEGMLDWRGALLIDRGRACFHSGDGTRGTGACWRPSPGTPVQLQLKMSQESAEIGLGAPRWWWKEGGAERWKVKGAKDMSSTWN